MNEKSSLRSPSFGDGALLEGREAARELVEALALVGVKLPSLRGDFPVMGKGFVHLGGAGADEVRRLASWIRERAES
ncbi:hypothetical protein [Streptomyces sp. NPDC003077]|uniref:hypothetical protein n=1 Tax=Streptomyces sp. NPDC003077 TaxID=3154443 RepID=UPI0033BF6386